MCFLSCRNNCNSFVPSPMTTFFVRFIFHYNTHSLAHISSFSELPIHKVALLIALQSLTLCFLLLQVIYLLFLLCTRGSGKALTQERNCKNCLTFFVARCGLYRCSLPVDSPELPPTNCYTQTIIKCVQRTGRGQNKQT